MSILLIFFIIAFMFLILETIAIRRNKVNALFAIICYLTGLVAASSICMILSLLLQV